MRMVREAGFTLFEVLVALAVISFGLAGLWKGLNQSINVADALPDRVIARWVAQNRLVLRQARSDWPQTREYNGVDKMDGREWYWQEKVRATEDPLLRKVTVFVRTGKKTNPIYSIEGYLKRPRPGANQGGTRSGRVSSLRPAPVVEAHGAGSFY